MRDSQKIPLEVLFKKAEKDAIKISPDGEKISYLKNVNGKASLIIMDINKKEEKSILTDIDDSIMDYQWTFDNDRILIIKDHNGNENFRLYEIELSSKAIKEITPFDNIVVRSINLSPEYRDHILFEMNKENPTQFDVYKYHLKSGNISIFQKNPDSFSQWVYTEEMTIGAGVKINEDGSQSLMVRNSNNEFKQLLLWNIEDGFSNSPLFFSKDGKYIYVISDTSQGTLGLIKIDIENGEKIIIACDDRYDIRDVCKKPVNGDIEAVSFVRYINEYKVVDKNKEEDYLFINKNIDSEFYVVSRSLNNEAWIIKAISLTGLVSFYLYKDKKLTLLFEQNSELKNYKLSKHEGIRYTSRDGLTIEGYITYPQGQKKEKLPLVLNVHGGPWYREYVEDLSREAQWIANRGYICLNVNFRGSTGYGKDFLNKGNKQWGRDMHNDLIDAINWAISSGIADKDRICIMGMSYGGYATLAGVTLTPDIFKCAIDRVGPSNLINLMNSLPDHWRLLKDNYFLRVGHPIEDKELLMEVSPIFHLDKIKVPILIAHGLNDPRVNVSESENIVKHLKESNKVYEYILFEDEGHLINKEKNNYIFYKAAENFLNKYL